MPAGYGEALLPLAECKAHLKVLHDDEDALIGALRDAAIEFVERYCSVKLGPVEGLTWRAEGLPSRAGDAIDLAVHPVSAVTAVGWLDSDGVEVAGAPSDYRVAGRSLLRLVPGGAWPSGVSGGVVVTFDAGYPEGEAPPMLLQAAKLMLGHLYLNREAVIVGTISGEAPFGVTSLCAPFRPVTI